MNSKELSKYCIDSLLKKGMDKVEFYMGSSKKYELNTGGDEIILFRTIFDTSVNITVIKDCKKGVINLNKTDAESINEAMESLIEIVNNSEADPANDISPMQPAGNFTRGETEPDLDRMYGRLNNFLVTVKEEYPKVQLMENYLDFTQKCNHYANSNGVELDSSSGNYGFQAAFAAKEGEKSSSFNYSGFTVSKLDKELLECGSMDILVRQSVEQLETKALEGKFTGDVIITPDCLESMIELYMDVYLRDMALIAGTSTLKDRLNQRVASEKLTLHSNPVSEEIPGGYFITPDGFEAKNMTIIDKGILRTFMLSLYGANKTGGKRALNPGGTYVVEPGEKSFDEIVKATKRGIIVARFSGGRPNRSGDFSGVAKNSYYVEDGEIKYPVNETMISGNLYDMFSSIVDISQERVNFGSSILPWVAASGVTISGR